MKNLRNASWQLALRLNMDALLADESLIVHEEFA
jgi:hypothetical protein